MTSNRAQEHEVAARLWSAGCSASSPSHGAGFPAYLVPGREASPVASANVTLGVLINTRDTPTPISLKLAPPWYAGSGKELVVDPSGERVKKSGDGSFRLTLPPRARWSLLLSGESLMAEPGYRGRID